MNYRKYETPDELKAAALRKVRPEWLTEKFLDAIRQPFIYLHACAQKYNGNYCPEAFRIFRPFKIVSPQDVKVVIVAQDPYPRLEDANGIAFMVGEGKSSASLINMKKCLKQFDRECAFKCTEYDLKPWIRQGVLLMNVTFTTKEHVSGSHGHIWKGVAGTLLEQIPKDSVALLLGRDAKEVSGMIPSRIKIEHLHPTERSGSFYRRDIFGEVNEALVSMQKSPINWRMHGPLIEELVANDSA